MNERESPVIFPSLQSRDNILKAPERQNVSGLLIWGITVLGLGIRLYHLGTYSYWHDEVHNLEKARRLWGVIFHGDLVSNHPPLFTVLIACWRFIGLGDNEASMRLLPTLIGTATIPVLFLLGRKLAGNRVALWAALLLAISPFHVFHSQELKEYILLPLTGTGAVWALVNALETNRCRSWAIYAFVALLACYSENHALLLLTAVNLWAVLFVLKKPAQWRYWFSANVVVFFLYVP